MRRLALTLTSLLALVLAGTTSAQISENTAIPQLQPVILGDVSSVTAHTVTVTTGAGESMAFEFDSRTVKPVNLQEGDPVRIEFRLLDSGLHFAQRVTTLTPGSTDWNALQEQRGTSGMYDQDNDNDRDDTNRGATMSNREESNESNEPNASARDRAEDRAEAQASGANPNERYENNVKQNGSDNTKQELPATASEMPWLLVAGSLLLAVAGVMFVLRRRTA